MTAFDVSESAIAWSIKRFPNSEVNYVVADLFKLPSDWLGAFDLVFDFRTIQALPLGVRSQTIENIASLARPEGTVLIMTYVRPSGTTIEGPPWPLTLEELNHFETVGLTVVKQEIFRKKGSRFSDRIQIHYKA